MINQDQPIDFFWGVALSLKRFESQRVVLSSPVNWIPRATIATATTSLEKSGAGEVLANENTPDMGPEIIWAVGLLMGFLKIGVWKFQRFIYDSYIYHLMFLHIFHISYFHLTIPRSSLDPYRSSFHVSTPGACGRFVSASTSNAGCRSATCSSAPSSKPTCRWMRPPKESWTFQLLGTGWSWMDGWMDGWATYHVWMVGWMINIHVFSCLKWVSDMF